MAAIKKENRIQKLFRFVMPSVLGSVSIFLYSIVDGVFVGRGIGGNALGAVNIAFPYVMFFTAFLMLVTVGGMTITAIRIGREDAAGANQVFMHSFMLSLTISAVMAIPCILFPQAVCRLLGASDSFVEPAAEYLFYYGLFFIPCGLCISLQGFCRNDNAPVLVSISTVTGAALNIIGDYVLIFPLHMGLKGAAIATGVAQLCALLVVLIHFIRKDGILRFHREKRDMELVGKILKRGAPECVSQFSVPVATALTNHALTRMLGDAAVNAFALIQYAAAFTVSVFLGTAEGIQPLFGNCYGAQNKKDLKFYFRSGLIISLVGSVLLSILILALWEDICTLFGVTPDIRACAVAAIPNYIPGFTVQALTVIITAYLYSTTRTKQALTINLLRSFFVVIPVILLVPVIFGADAIWHTFWIYEGISLIAAFFILRAADKKDFIEAGKE